MAAKVSYGSLELVCFHEGGHAATAIQVGAQIENIEIYKDAGRYFGRVRATRTDDQSRHILLGGFSAEYILFTSGLLLNADGSSPTEKQFIDQSMDNAIIDRINFFKINYGLDVDASNVPVHLDERFMSYAIGRAKDKMPFDAVERIANSLIARRTLGADEIHSAFVG